MVIGVVLKRYLLDGNDAAQVPLERFPALDLLQQSEIGGTEHWLRMLLLFFLHGLVVKTLQRYALFTQYATYNLFLLKETESDPKRQSPLRGIVLLHHDHRQPSPNIASKRSVRLQTLLYGGEKPARTGDDEERWIAH